MFTDNLLLSAISTLVSPFLRPYPSSALYVLLFMFSSVLLCVPTISKCLGPLGLTRSSHPHTFLIFLLPITPEHSLTTSHRSYLLTILSPWGFLRVVWSIPLVTPQVTTSRFFADKREAELKPTTFSSLFFRVFLSSLFS